MARFLALDPSSRQTGWAIFEGDRLLAVGLIATGRKDSYATRYLVLEERLAELLEAWDFTEVAYESGSWGRYKVSALQVAIYTIKTWCRQHHIVFYEYAPAAVKRGVTGSGRASKEELARVVYLQFPELKGDLSSHIMDSIGVAICHMGWRRIRELALPRKEQCLVIILDGEELATVRNYRKGVVKSVMKGAV